jgi:hypothetical protein
MAALQALVEVCSEAAIARGQGIRVDRDGSDLILYFPGAAIVGDDQLQVWIDGVLAEAVNRALQQVDAFVG